MNSLRTVSIGFIVAGFFVWLVFPFVSFEFLTVEESFSAASLMFSGDSEMSSALDKAWKSTWFYWMSLFSLLALGGGLLDVCTKKPGKGLVSFAGLGIFFLAGGALLTSGAMNQAQEESLLFSSVFDMHFGIGFILLLLDFIVLCCLGNTMKKTTAEEGSISTPARMYGAGGIADKVNVHIASDPNTRAVDTTGMQWLKCCQCERIAKRTEFYTVGVNGNANLGICQKCYDQFY